jgi:hypothetical protein
MREDVPQGQHLINRRIYSTDERHRIRQVPQGRHLSSTKCRPCGTLESVCDNRRINSTVNRVLSLRDFGFIVFQVSLF